MPGRSRIPRWKFDHARAMRRIPTVAEDRMWELLRARRFKGFKFRRQAPMYGYITDLYCPELRLCVEVDGPGHENQKSYDAHRDAILARYGVRTIRISNDDVLAGRGLRAIALRMAGAKADRIRSSISVPTTHPLVYKPR